MNKFIFDSWKDWKNSILVGFGDFLVGFCRIVVVIIIGIFSLLVHLWRISCRFVSRYPNIAICAFILIAFIVWCLTFAHMRYRAVGAEDQLDSITWQFKNFKKMHGYD